jgi:hypothetical protein
MLVAGAPALRADDAAGPAPALADLAAGHPDFTATLLRAIKGAFELAAR